MAAERLNELRDKALNLRDDVVNIVQNPWPQTIINPDFSKTKGFLPPLLVPPSREVKFDATPGRVTEGETEAISGKYNQYEFKDWLGQMITPNGLVELETKDRFNESLNLRKGKSELSSEPYSMRDHYLIFGDTTTDYFRHGLQIIDGLTPIQDDGLTDLRLSQFKYTPFENNDPVILGFDLIIDDIYSPLLNGSVLDFLNNYKNVKEIESRINVYEDFKNQFIKFFKTRSSVAANNIDQEKTSITRTTTPNSQIGKSRGIYQGNGSRAYMNYYIQKISGLKNLIEMNKPGTFKYLADYRKDQIKIDIMEDVSLSFATLAHLYKLLYWSKPNGKNIVPENLLRFNCDIVVSECRNFNRVKKALDSGDIEVVKDNVSRYIYSLRECQFFFDEVHEDSIDMGNIKQQGNTSVNFDYKYSTVNFERFVPTTDGLGQYVGYNNGSIWKIGNPGVRNGTQSLNQDISVPRFQTFGENKLRQNGVEEPFVFKYVSDNNIEDFEAAPLATPSDENNSASDLEQDSKKTLKQRAEDLKNKTVESAKRELQTAINIRTQLLSRTINKTLISLQGGTITPPRNIYTDPQPGTVGNFTNRFFYDVRGELVGFLGDSLGSAITGIGGNSGLSGGFSG